MSSLENLRSFIRKLYHPLQEIRERSLQLLRVKLRLGWLLDDELSGTREVLEALLDWLQAPKPSLQKEVFNLILQNIKTKAGNYVCKQIGINKMLSVLTEIKHKIDIEAEESYNDVVETLQFLSTVESCEDINVPRLEIPSVTSSDRGDSSSGFYHLDSKSSKETSAHNNEIANNKHKISESADDTIKVILFPWAELCSSDVKTILLVEDALRLLRSTRRCCRFIRDVFLRDFPPEIFLNRPAIIQSLMNIISGRRPGEGLLVLLYIMRALCTRLLQLASLETVHAAYKVSDNFNDAVSDNVNNELEQIAGNGNDPCKSIEEDALVSLRQLPAPIFALNSLQTVLGVMARSIEPVDIECPDDSLDLNDLNTCVCLVEYSVQLLLDCVSEHFWRTEHHNKIYRDVAHKSCMVMRLMGDLLMKYKSSFTEFTDRFHHRVSWLRVISCAERLLYWSRDSALSPTSLVTSLQTAYLDPALELFYPKLIECLSKSLQEISVDREFKSKNRELMDLLPRMEDAVKFMKNKNNCRASKEVFSCINNSLPTLELHSSETYLNDVSEFLLRKTKDFEMTDEDWSRARRVALKLMAHKFDWVPAKFYSLLRDLIKEVLINDNVDQERDEKCLTLLCDVGVLTEICCHGLSSNVTQVATSAADVMVYLLRGRLILSESCWWKLLVNLLPVLPLLHVYTAHDTPLGEAVCKSLEPHIAQCMGVSEAELVAGLSRILFVRCVPAQIEAAHFLCRMLDDDRYLPPKDSLRPDVLLNALNQIECQDFNIDTTSSTTKITQNTGLVQILDVLKQDIVLDEHGTECVVRSSMKPILEPSLRRSTLQQLSVLMRQQELHDTFLQLDGLKVVLAILRMSLLVDDYLAFPECAISCVSVLNSVCFTSRHILAKTRDLYALLLRVILVFPANESTVLMAAQVIALVAWSGFALQELSREHQRVCALPLCVMERTKLPFIAQSYWDSSPNAEHSALEWLLTDEEWRTLIRVRWWCAWEGNSRVLRTPHPSSSAPAPLTLRPSPRDLALLQTACPLYSCTKGLLALENATSHTQVIEAFSMLGSYIHLVPLSNTKEKDIAALPWQHIQRFLQAPPASPKDTTLMIALLQFIITYMDNVDTESGSRAWVKSYFIESDTSMISLLNRDHFFPQQSVQETIDVVHLQTHIVKVILRCVIDVNRSVEYDVEKMESLVSTLLTCLERIDLNNFHMLGYLNELMRCTRYAMNCHHCKLSEECLIRGMKVMTSILGGCAAGGGRKGEACRLDALLSLLAILRQICEVAVPVQRWSEIWGVEVTRCVISCAGGNRVELRAAALNVMATLAQHTQFMPQLLQAIPNSSVVQYAAEIFATREEANVVRTAAVNLLISTTAHASPKTDLLLIIKIRMWLATALLLFILTLLILLTIFHYATDGRKYWFHRKVPYREPCPIFGNFGATFTMRQTYTSTLQFFYDLYKNEKFVGLFQARRPTLMVKDLDMVKNIMSKEFSNFSDRVAVMTDTRREPLLRNLANMSGAEWKSMRQIVTPTFSTAKMKAMFPLIADCTKNLSRALIQEATSDVDVPNLASRFTTDVIGSCAFGIDPGSLQNNESPFLIMSRKMFKTDRATILKRYCRAFFPKLFKLLNLRTYTPDVETFFTSIISQVLNERRATGTQRNDFLQLMLNVQKTEKEFDMTDELITSNSFIFMLAGLETSSTTMSFCLYELAKHQNVQEIVRKEIFACKERHGGINYEAVCAMRLLTQTVLETLRLHPPTPMTTRMCTATCKLIGTELSMNVRDPVLIPIYCIQRDPELFPNPDKFDIDRYEDNLNPSGFLAFGDGPRSCPGARFAQLTILAGLAAILSQFVVEPSARTTPQIQYDPRSVMLKNKGGIWLSFKAIQ